MKNTLNRTIFTALLLSALTACSILPESEPVQLLDPRLPSSSPETQTQSAPWTLNVTRPESDPTRDSTRVLVRTGQGQLQVHPTGRWVAAAPELLRSLLVRHLRDANVLSQVSAGAAGMDRTLALDLRRFELAETGENGLQSEIQVEARLFDSRSAELLGSKLFENRQPVDAADTDAIVQGFETALGEIIPALADWLAETADAD